MDYEPGQGEAKKEEEGPERKLAASGRASSAPQVTEDNLEEGQTAVNGEPRLFVGRDVWDWVWNTQSLRGF